MTLGAFVVGAVVIGVYATKESKSDESDAPRYRPTYEPTSPTERPSSYSYEPVPQQAPMESVPAPARSEPASQNAFTLGSSRDQVTAAQGTPSSIDKSMGETWWYGGSRIEFRGGRVFEWNASAFARLNAVLRPANQTTVEAAKSRGTFTLGSSKDEVLALEGTPTTVDRTLTDSWWYGANRIEFRNGRVLGWNTSPMERPIHAVLLPRNQAVAAAAKARGNYGPNATKDEVLAVEGTPTTVDPSLGETWWYGAARIEFRSGRIRDFDASPMSPLHVKMPEGADVETPARLSAQPPSRRIPYAREEAPREPTVPRPTQTFGVGSSSGDVLAAQGKPQRVIDVDSATEIWQYGSSTVTIRSGRVREYSNLGSLNVR